MLQRLELVVEQAHASAARDRLVQHGPAGHLLDILPEVANRQFLRNRDVSIVRNFIARDHPEQRRLAGAVGADETDLLPGVELK